MKYSAKNTKILLIILVVFGIMVTVFDRYIVFNVTESFPPGLYLKVDEKPEKGSLVIFCPEKSPIQDETLERNDQDTVLGHRRIP